MSRIALIGFMASGKSTVGRQLARALGWQFADTDTELQRLFQYSAGEYLREFGEGKFRAAEFESLKLVPQISSNVVLATGGGIVTYPSSREYLNEHFYVVWLRITPDTVLRRLQKDNVDRPLVADNQDARVPELMAKRQVLYQQAADFVVDVDELSPHEVTDSVLRAGGWNISPM